MALRGGDPDPQDRSGIDGVRHGPWPCRRLAEDVTDLACAHARIALYLYISRDSATRVHPLDVLRRDLDHRTQHRSLLVRRYLPIAAVRGLDVRDLPLRVAGDRQRTKGSGPLHRAKPDTGVCQGDLAAGVAHH